MANPLMTFALSLLGPFLRGNIRRVLNKVGFPLSRNFTVKFMCVNTIDAMCEESRRKVRVETHSTLTSKRDTSYIASISFMRVRT